MVLKKNEFSVRIQEKAQVNFTQGLQAKSTYPILIKWVIVACRPSTYSNFIVFWVLESKMKHVYEPNFMKVVSGQFETWLAWLIIEKTYFDR